MGQSPNSKNYTDNPNDHILVQGNADLVNGQVLPRIFTKQVTKVAHAGDILMSVRAPVGNIAQTQYEVVIGRGVAAISGNLFLKQLLDKMDKTGYWNKYIAGSTFESINSNDIKNASIKIPNLGEQEKIGQLFQNLDHTITLHEEKQKQLEQLKKALLQKMFADKSGYPELRFKGFADTWEQRQLGEMGSTFSGLSGKNKEDFGHGNARFITYMNVYSNPIANPKGTEHIEIDPKQHQVKFGDILFTTSSETPEEVGMSSVWLSNDENVYLNSFCFGYRVLSNQKINPYYMAYLLRSDSFRRKVTLLAQGISRYNISKKHVMGISISFPVLEEQKKVGRLFQKLDQAITLHAKKTKQLKQLKQALLQKMFV